MPRIPEYLQQTVPGGSFGAAPNARGSRFDGSIGEGLGSLAGAAAHVSNATLSNEARQKREADRVKEEDATAWVAQALADSRLKWTQESITRRDAAEPGAAGHTEKLVKDFDGFAATTVENAPTPRAKAMMQVRLTDLRTSLVGDALTWEATERRKYRVDQVGDATDKAALTADIDPRQYNTLVAEQVALIDSLELHGADRDKMLSAAREKIAQAAVIGTMRRDPRATLKVLNSDLTTKEGRPIIGNADGSVSTERTITVTVDELNGGKPTNIPTLVNGKEVDEKAAIGAALASGKKYPGFESIPEAEAAAVKRSADLGAQISPMQAAVANLSLEAKVRLRNSAESEVHRLDAEARANAAIARAEFDRRVDNSTSMLLTLGTSPNAPSAHDFAAMYGPQEGARRYQAFQGIEQLGADVSAVKGLSYAEQDKLLAGRRPDQATPEFATAQKRYEALAQAVHTVRQQVEKDPAAYVLTSSATVKAAYGAMADALKAQDATPEQVQAASANYAQAMRVEQERRGIPGGVRLLPKDYAESIQTQFADPANAGRKQADLVGALASQWGDAWPQVFGELQDKLPQSSLVIGSGMAPGPAARLADLSTAKVGDLKDQLPSGTPADVHAAVLEAMAPLNGSLRPLRGGSNTISVYQDAAERMALSYAAEGMKAPAAAARAAEEVAGWRYVFEDGYRVPREQDATQVRRGAAAVLAGLKPSDLAEFAPGSAQGELVNPSWVTIPGDKGLALYVNGNHVARIDGTPVRYTWDELRAAGTKPAEIVPSGAFSQ